MEEGSLFLHAPGRAGCSIGTPGRMADMVLGTGVQIGSVDSVAH
jgi:hypothetical protein